MLSIIGPIVFSLVALALVYHARRQTKKDNIKASDDRQFAIKHLKKSREILAESRRIGRKQLSLLRDFVRDMVRLKEKTQQNLQLHGEEQMEQFVTVMEMLEGSLNRVEEKFNEFNTMLESDNQIITEETRPQG